MMEVTRQSHVPTAAKLSNYSYTGATSELSEYPDVSSSTELEKEISSSDPEKEINPYIIQQHQLRNQSDIIHKFILFAVILSLWAAAIYCLSELEFARYKVLSAVVAIPICVCYFYFVYLIGSASELHSICLITTSFDSFGHQMLLPTKLEHFPFRPIKFASRLLAVRGGTVQSVYIVTITVSTGVYIGATLFHWMECKALMFELFSSHYMELVFSMCTAAGYFMIGYFEMSAYSVLHTSCHYIGVLLASMSVWPLAIHSEWSALSIALIAVPYGLLFVWLYFVYTFPDDFSQDIERGMSEREVIQKVHRVSACCLLIQLTCVFSGAFSFFVYLWHIESVC